VDEHCSIRARLDNLIPRRGLVPDEAILPSLIADDATENPIPIVGDAVGLLSDSSVITGDLVNADGLVLLEEAEQDGFD
jgi:hypothetical protein